MQIDRVAVPLRERTPWQAIDLGTLLARRWWWSLCLAWAIPATTLFALLALLLPTAWLWSLSLVIWWLKPLWDCFPLLIASRRLFGEEMSPQQAWRQVPRLLGTEVLAWLTWRRLSLHRSADLPVTLLERLRGKQRAQRLTLLHATHGSAASWLTIAGTHLEMAISIGIIGLVAMLLPEQVDIDYWSLLISEERAPQIGVAALTLLSSIVVAPFYTAAGFALYINRRVELEGWDIEVRFRQLAQRRSAAAPRVAATLLLGLALLWQPSAPVSAQPETPPTSDGIEAAAAVDEEAAEADANPERHAVRERIDAVLASPDFGKKETVTRWRLKNDDKEKKEEDDKVPDWLRDLFAHLDLGDSAWLVTVAAVLKYLLVLLLAIVIAWTFWHYRDALQRWRPRLEKRERKAVPPAQLFGLELKAETLPPDPLAAAQQLWPQQPRAALALLYRSALVQLLARGCPLRDHHTEHECAQLATTHLSPTASALFSELTRLWQRLAYAHQLPTDAEMAPLWQRWAQEFADA